MTHVQQQTGTKFCPADEYIAAPTWVATQTGRTFTRVHTLLMQFGILSPDTVDQRAYGDVRCTKPVHVKSLLEEKGLTPEKVDRDGERWLAELRLGAEQSRKRREGRHQNGSPHVKRFVPKPLSPVQQVLAQINTGEVTNG